MNSDHPCEICGMPATDRHHVYFGNKNRHWSEKYGLVAFLCRRHHEHVHMDRAMDLRIKSKYQNIFEEQYDRKLFMQVFGRNYL